MPRKKTPLTLGARLRCGILCDQIRTEDNGKRLLIGVYDAGINISIVPSPFSGWIYGAFELESPGSVVINFKIHAGSVEEIGRVVAGSEAEAGTVGPFMVPFTYLIEEAGDIRLDWQIDDGPWMPGMKWAVQIPDTAFRLQGEQAETMRRLASEAAAAKRTGLSIAG